jgi:hypothetical protein
MYIQVKASPRAVASTPTAEADVLRRRYQKKQLSLSSSMIRMKSSAF